MEKYVILSRPIRLATDDGCEVDVYGFRMSNPHYSPENIRDFIKYMSVISRFFMHTNGVPFTTVVQDADGRTRMCVNKTEYERFAEQVDMDDTFWCLVESDFDPREVWEEYLICKAKWKTIISREDIDWKRC